VEKRRDGGLWRLWYSTHGSHWQGAADFLVEITSPGERTREKLPFYSRIGVVELLIVDREPWTLELYHNKNGQRTLAGRSSLAAPNVLVSQTVGLTFQLAAGDARPQIQVTHPANGQLWQI
jgi:Uma2 family endonuclease